MSASRKQLGAWYTPADLVEAVVDSVITPEFVATRRSPITVLDPACGDGRFLVAAGRRIAQLGAACRLTGCDIDPAAVESARSALPRTAELRCADSLAMTWDLQRFDLVVGNPPFLSQMASATTRGGTSRHGGGPYADAAAEFLALAGELADPEGGRIALVLPQSLLASRDAASIRRSIAERAHLVWSWWSDRRMFDAQVHVCVVAFEFGRPEPEERRANWSHVATTRMGVPVVHDDLEANGCLGDRARLNANFRDEYYGMIPAVGDHDSGPRLITSGLIDPGRTWWGERPIRFAKRSHARPRVDLARLDDDMVRWARRRLVPKVLVANQTRIVEAVCDPGGDWLPAVPVLGVYPTGAHWDDADERPAREVVARAWEIAAVLTSAAASAWLWHRGAGTGLSVDSIRLSPVTLAELPWPAGDLDDAVEAVRLGDVRGCNAAVSASYGIIDDAALSDWWTESLLRIELRQPSPTHVPPPTPPG